MIIIACILTCKNIKSETVSDKSGCPYRRLSIMMTIESPSVVYMYCYSRQCDTPKGFCK